MTCLLDGSFKRFGSVPNHFIAFTISLLDTTVASVKVRHILGIKSRMAFSESFDNSLANSLIIDCFKSMSRGKKAINKTVRSIMIDYPRSE